LFLSLQKRGEKKTPNSQRNHKRQQQHLPTNKQTNKQKRERASILSSPLLSSPHKDKTTKEYLNTNPTTKAAEKSPLQQPKSPQQFH
jgi:hypothetical protein